MLMAAESCGPEEPASDKNEFLTDVASGGPCESKAARKERGGTRVLGAAGLADSLSLECYEATNHNARC